MENRFGRTTSKFCLTTLYMIAAFNVEPMHRAASQTPSAVPTSSNDTIEFNTKGKTPGEPTNSINDLKKIHQYIALFRQRNGGSYPANASSLFDDMVKNLGHYGLTGFADILAVFTNPDSIYADEFTARADPASVSQIVMFNVRPDGFSLNSPKVPGVKDVLAYTPTYHHYNVYTLKKAQASTVNPAGFYLVLWDDGQVGKIDYDDILYIRKNGDFEAFRDQAGVSFDCLTYAEYYFKNAGFVPLGKPVAEGKNEPDLDNGGPESLICFSRLLATPTITEPYLHVGIDREELWKQFPPTQPEFTLTEVAQGAVKLGLPLQQKKLSLDELQKLGTPAIFLTSDSKRIVTLANVDDKEAIVLDQGMTRIVSREVLQKRYGGEALIAEAAAKAPANAPRVLADDPIRVIDVKDRGADIKQEVKITNSGKAPLTLQIERPIPGGKEADLSSETVAPGQSSTLSLTLR